MKALRWREDVDLIAKTITVKQQTCYGVTTPKGRTRRTNPMTSTLEGALRRLEVVREGFVVRNLDGSAKTDGQANAVILRICRRAGLPEKRWHTLRHAFGTHAALFGVNPWRLQSWMGTQADRRDDDLRPRGGSASPERSGVDRVRGLRRARSGRRILKMLAARDSGMAVKRGVSGLNPIITFS